ncbi:unnamed protein product [Moneuplotes crassus]|uniref:Uncharacterized protein n=1 Tax=Euplotes crassus TaxID=5936 RepID=A0AAD1Y6X9_EUPCR|nr:unnamed protein product [Moneuplotes crassus]
MESDIGLESTNLYLFHPLVGHLFTSGPCQDLSSAVAIKQREKEFRAEQEQLAERSLSQVRTISSEISLVKAQKENRHQSVCSNSCERTVPKIHNNLRNKLVPYSQKKIEKSCIMDFHSEGQENTSHTSSSKNKVDMRSFDLRTKSRRMEHTSSNKEATKLNDFEQAKTPLTVAQMSRVGTQITLGEPAEAHIEYIKKLESIIAGLKAELNLKSQENETLKNENTNLKQLLSKNDHDKFQQLSNSFSDKDVEVIPTEENEEELDSFILAEKTAVDEVMKNPLQNPIREILSMKAKVSSVDRKKSQSKRSSLRMPLTVGSIIDNDLSQSRRKVLKNFRTKATSPSLEDYNGQLLSTPLKMPYYMKAEPQTFKAEKKEQDYFGEHFHYTIDLSKKAREKSPLHPNLTNGTPSQAKDDTNPFMNETKGKYSQGISNQKKAFVKEVSVHLNCIKQGKSNREWSLNNHLRATSKESNNSISFGGSSKKYSYIKSRLHQPTSTSKIKKEATFVEKSKHAEKKKREKHKVALKFKSAKGYQDHTHREMTKFNTKESSPTIPVKDYSNFKYPKKRSMNLIDKEPSLGIQGSRKKRKNRHEKKNSERLPQIPHSSKK